MRGPVKHALQNTHHVYIAFDKANGEIKVNAMSQESANACRDDIHRLLLGPRGVDEVVGAEESGSSQGGSVNCL